MEEPEKTRSKSWPRLGTIWSKAGLDVPTLIKMVKFALPPTISLCLYQAGPIAHTFGSVGYLIAVAAVLSSVLTPRATFIEMTICNVLSVSLTTLVSIFASWTIITSRHANMHPQSAQKYNSSASAVAGVWFFIMLYIINALKFTRPQFKFAGVMCSILTIVTMTYAPQLHAMGDVLSLIKRIYSAFMTGIGIAVVISLGFKPTSCRQVVFKDISQYLCQLRRTLECERKYMETLEMNNPFRSRDEGEEVLDHLKGLRAVHSSLFAHLSPAKKEMAYGNLAAPDLKEIQRILRRIFLPVIGVGSLVSIFERLAWQHGWDTRKGTDAETASEHQLSMEYQDLMKSLHSHIGELNVAMEAAFDHARLLLKLDGWKAIQARQNDPEANAIDAQLVGTPEFAKYLEEKVDEFHDSKTEVLREWCSRHGISLAPDSFETDFEWLSEEGTTLLGTPSQRQLFVVLYIEYLEWSAARATLRLVRFADHKVADGTMARKRFIFPHKALSKWRKTFARNENTEDSLDAQEALRGAADTTRTLWTSHFKAFKKDPEHLPRTKRIHAIGTGFRAVGRLFRSQHSQFGFRLACAALSLQILAYLQPTQQFFVYNRGFWGTIMIAVSMTRTSGEAAFIYFLRLLGTLLGAVACFVVYYIVNGVPAGVLVFYFLASIAYGYVPCKKPHLALATIISSITMTLVIGYELQVQKIGVILATANQQRYYPIYILAPYRLATTAGGIFIAFIFTIFPFPISEGSELRKDLGVALYTLASHYSLVQETLSANISGKFGDLSLRSSPGRKLERARVKLMSRHMLLLASMRQQSDFTKWQIPIDSPFPKETYDKIINLVEDLLNFTALTGYVASSLAINPDEASQETQEWHQTFSALQDSLQSTSDEITSLLCLLSSSILHAQPLPPHLRLPPAYLLLQRLQGANRHMLDISHVDQKGYSAFAVLQIASRFVIVDLYKLVDHVKELVGELDFSGPYSSTKLSREVTKKSKQY